MPEPSHIEFSYQEVVTAMIKAADIHDGIWGLFIKFGLSASNVGETESILRPAAIIPVLDIGLQKFEKETNMSVDAKKVNPQLELPDSRAEGKPDMPKSRRH